MILYGTNPIAWSNDDDRSLGAEIPLETCLRQASQIGFDGIEKGHKFPDEPQALKAALAPHGLRYVSGWYSLHLLARSAEEEKKAIQPHLDLLKAMGSSVCIVCECSNAIHGDDGAALNDRPRLAEADSGPATGLLLDTGHAFFGGGDPAALARRHMGRVVHLHAKNVRPQIMRQVREEGLSFLQGVRRGVFTVPGDPEGAVAFEPVLQIAAAHGYSRWLVIEAEQDPALREPVTYQSMGLAALRRMAREAGLDKAAALA